MTRVVIIGGGAAGMAAASRVKRLRKDFDVVVFERTPYVSFALCGIPYLAGCTVKTLDELLYYPPEFFVKKRGIDLRLRTKVTKIDPSGKTLTYKNLETGEEGELEWDYLVLAPGARSRAPEIWPEIKELENVFYITHLDSGERIRSYALKLKHGSKAVIVGAGYVGLEMAENLSNLGMKVTVVEALPHVAPRTLDPDYAEIVEQHLKEKGVEVITGAPVKEFKAVNGKAKAIVTDKGEIEGDLFVVGVGIRPNTELAQQIGARIGETGAIWVDEKLRTSVKDVYAVGDAVEHTDIVTGRRVWRPFAPVANKMGYIAGSVIAGRDAVFMGSVGTSTFKTFDMVVARTGLSAEEAKKLGYNVEVASLEGYTKAHYIPGRTKVYLRVIADTDTGRLLGAQSVGATETVLWRINVIASLLTVKATVWDLFFSDIGYAPPLAPVWDPLIIAARLLMRKLGERPRKQ
ncbi:MAG: FAD-dependent oxidoreductase [Desulfurococcales archaeon]|nr:FAD-dependent oxidoreductase [Desulfurococcales archaeon]